MKYLAAVAFVCFMGISVYVLLNEKNMANPHAKVKNFKPVRAKKIGELHRGDMQAYELQRQRIDETTVYKFESLDKSESYEMNEDDMNEFARSLSAFKEIKKGGQIDWDRPIDISNEREYYEVD